MADKTSYCSQFPCHHSKICQKDSPHQNVFKLTLSQKSFYVFRKDRRCKFLFLLSPSLDLINIISVRRIIQKPQQSQMDLLPYQNYHVKTSTNVTKVSEQVKVISSLLNGPKQDDQLVIQASCSKIPFRLSVFCVFLYISKKDVAPQNNW